MKRLLRFIPVGAGNTIAPPSHATGRSVYPRGCGELNCLAPFRLPTRGLSTWVRGTPGRRQENRGPPRFIPVGAGNSLGGSLPPPLSAVYPRGCGELDLKTSLYCQWVGLSPWVRGTLFHTTQADIHIRFIPVGAGNSQFWEDIEDDEPVYPRGCGEHIVC